MKEETLYSKSLSEIWSSEKNMEKIPYIKRLYEMYEKGFLGQEEFEFGKMFLLTYDGNRTLNDYNSFLDAIMILHKAINEEIITKKFYQNAVQYTLSMKKDKFLAQLLFARVITMSNYIYSEKSRCVNFIRENDLISFGCSTPPRIAIMLSEKCGFKAIKVSLNMFKQKIVMARGANRYTIYKGLSLFGSAKVYIKDEKGQKYTYVELLKKVKGIDGTL